MSLKDIKPSPEPPDRTVYRPSPRPRFTGPAAIPYSEVTRHVWGDAEAGQVYDWIYASTDKIHALVFGLAPGGAFRHSLEFRTVFGADEVLCVLTGLMVLANPETGEVIRVPAGEHAFFRAGTWHHVFAHGPEPLRVLELLAPPPAKGTTGPYARTREYLDVSRYVDDSQLGHLNGERAPRATLRWLRPDDVVYRLEGDCLIGVLVSTEHLTAASLALPPGKSSGVHSHGGDEIVYVTEGTLSVRAWSPDQTHVFELSPRDGAFIPAGVAHEYRNYSAGDAAAIVGIAPQYLDAPVEIAT
jgi:quercetin dioxygenase-like cupin family protein